MKTFKNGDNTDNREITITIDDEFVSFYHEYLHDEDDYFYWIFIDDWFEKKEHIKEKRWFTNEMENFIDYNLNKNK